MTVSFADRVRRVRKALVAVVPAAVLIWNVAQPDNAIPEDQIGTLQQLLDNWIVATAAVATPVLVYMVPNDGTT